MNAAISEGCSNDIGILKNSIIEYVSLIVPERRLDPPILPSDKKSETRGFHHPMLTRLLCPVDKYSALMGNPTQYVTVLV